MSHNYIEEGLSRQVLKTSSSVEFESSVVSLIEGSYVDRKLVFCPILCLSLSESEFLYFSSSNETLNP